MIKIMIMSKKINLMDHVKTKPRTFKDKVDRLNTLIKM